jgi:hypothetical protein
MRWKNDQRAGTRLHGLFKSADPKHQSSTQNRNSSNPERCAYDGPTVRQYRCFWPFLNLACRWFIHFGHLQYAVTVDPWGQTAFLRQDAAEPRPQPPCRPFGIPIFHAAWTSGAGKRTMATHLAEKCAEVIEAG